MEAVHAKRLLEHWLLERSAPVAALLRTSYACHQQETQMVAPGVVAMTTSQNATCKRRARPHSCGPVVAQAVDLRDGQRARNAPEVDCNFIRSIRNFAPQEPTTSEANLTIRTCCGGQHLVACRCSSGQDALTRTRTAPPLAWKACHGGSGSACSRSPWTLPDRMSPSERRPTLSRPGLRTPTLAPGASQ